MEDCRWPEIHLEVGRQLSCMHMTHKYFIFCNSLLSTPFPILSLFAGPAAVSSDVVGLFVFPHTNSSWIYHRSLTPFISHSPLLFAHGNECTSVTVSSLLRLLRLQRWAVSSHIIMMSKIRVADQMWGRQKPLSQSRKSGEPEAKHWHCKNRICLLW